MSDRPNNQSDQAKQAARATPRASRDPVADAFARSLRARMVEFKLTQVELARRANVSRSNLSRFLAGKMTPTVSTLARIAAAFSAEVRDFFSFFFFLGCVPAEAHTLDEHAGCADSRGRGSERGLGRGWVLADDAHADGLFALSGAIAMGGAVLVALGGAA